MTYGTAFYWHAGAGGRKNEDSFSLQRVRVKGKEAVFCIVCDGIGGQKEGETASGFVTEQMTAWFYESGLALLARRHWKRRIRASAVRALSMTQEAMEQFERQEGIGCGTTCTMALLCGSFYLLFHSGDSRAYLLRPKRISRRIREKQLTQDHSSQGRLCRCMGGFGFQRPQIVTGSCKNGLLLLCTDGFCRSVKAGFFAEWLAQESWLADQKKVTDAVKQRLLQERLERAGDLFMACGEKDNLTAVALWIRRKNDRAHRRKI